MAGTIDRKLDLVTDQESLIHQYLQHRLAEVHAEAGAHGPELGVPPESFLVEQREPCGHETHNTGAVIKRWVVTLEGVEETTGLPEPSPTERGMYFEQGRADFAVRDGGKTVRIAWHVGPRYGRGCDILIVRHKDGSYALGAPSRGWVS